MSRSTRRGLGVCAAALLMSAPAQAQPAYAERTPGRQVVVSGQVALASLVALTDAYLLKFADSLTLFGSSAEARSADWEVIRSPLGELAERNVSALVWFALPDGSYWSVQQGQSSGNLADREYFTRVLAGETVIGALVVSKATWRSSAIVAVPVINDGLVVGVLGASIYLDELSERLDTEMAIEGTAIFYSFDATPLLALEWDPQLILVDPFSLGPEIRAVFEYMLWRETGSVRYRFRNQWRTVLFTRSQVTGWWFAFGEVFGNGGVTPGTHGT